MKFKTNTLIALCGVTLVLVGVHYYRVNRQKWLPTPTKLTITVPIIQLIEHCFETNGRAYCNLTQVQDEETLFVDLRYQTVMRVGEPFGIALTVENNPAIPRRNLATFQVLLSADEKLGVQPKEWLDISINGVAPQWSITPTEPGTYLLVLNARHFSSTVGAPVPFDFKLPLDRQVKVKGNWTYYAQKLWPFAVTVLGTFITLPGLIGLIKEARNRKKKRRAMGFVT